MSTSPEKDHSMSENPHPDSSDGMPRVEVTRQNNEPHARLTPASPENPNEIGEWLVDLYEARFDLLRNYIAGLVQNRAIAQEIAQETFMLAWIALQKGTRVEEGKGSGWLFRIAVHRVIDLQRRRRVIQEEPFDTADISDTTDVLTQVETRIVLQEVLSQLSPQYQAALWLRYVHGFSFEEIAEALGIEKTGAKMFLSRARAKAREARDRLEGH